MAADGRMREGTGVPIYRVAANLGVHARVGKPARTTARIGPVVARVGRKEGLTGGAGLSGGAGERGWGASRPRAIR